MESKLEVFTRRLYDEWLPTFCGDEKRRYSIAGFKAESIKITEFDATNFMRALDSGIVKDSGGGRYRCARSSAFEQIFWSGLKSQKLRSLTLWVEPVITIGTIARLGLDFGWPVESLCVQPKGWAFDFAIFQAKSNTNEYIAGEAKKTEKELDALITDLIEYGRLGATVNSEHPKRMNSFKKWQALQGRKAPLFWAVGPNNYTHLFSVRYGTDHTATFSESQLDLLKAPGHTSGT